LGRRAAALWLSLRGPQLKPTTGGYGLTTLKKLNGARLVLPSPFTVDTQAIGRGMTESRRNTYISEGAIADASMETTGWVGEPVSISR